MNSIDFLYAPCVCGKRWSEHDEIGRAKNCPRYEVPLKWFRGLWRK